jgi:hypothetical protein
MHMDGRLHKPSCLTLGALTIESWVGCRAGQDFLDKIKSFFPTGIDSQVYSDALVTIPTDLPRLFECWYR